MRFAVLMTGVLRGMGREAACELLATKTVVAEEPRPLYSHCAIIEAPSDLPDGEYEVEFGEEVAITRLHDGIWSVGRTLPHTYPEAVSFYSEVRQQSKSGRKESLRNTSSRSKASTR